MTSRSNKETLCSGGAEACPLPNIKLSFLNTGHSIWIWEWETIWEFHTVTTRLGSTSTTRISAGWFRTTITKKMCLELRYAFGASSATSTCITWRYGSDLVHLLREYGLLSSSIQSLMFWEELQLISNSWTEGGFLLLGRLLSNAKAILNFADQLTIVWKNLRSILNIIKIK